MSQQANVREGVSVAVLRTARPGKESALEAWMKRAIDAASAFDGHLGADVIRPAAGQRQYLLLFRFDSTEHLAAWERSSERATILREVDEITEGEAIIQRTSGLETWFTLPGGGALVPPPRWKMALVSWMVAFPTIQALNATLGKWLSPLPSLARGALVGASMVLVMTYVAMPWATRALAKWLYPSR